jgi:hypothetical protein
MAKELDWEVTEVLEALRWKRQQLAEIEQQWKEMRGQSRELTIRLVTQHSLSISKAADVSGHHRSTIKAWLDVWNAEQRILKKSKQ